MPVSTIPILIITLGLVTVKLAGSAFGILRSLTGKIDDGMKRNTDRKRVRRLLDLPPISYQQEWNLAAPESSALLNGLEDFKADGFRLGLLYLLAARVLVLEVFFDDQTGAEKGAGIGDTILERGPTSADRLRGSLGAIYKLWESLSEPRTIQKLAQETKQKYGSLADFTDIEVKPGLVSGGLYARREYQYGTFSQGSSYLLASSQQLARNETELPTVTSYSLTLQGQYIRTELESRMAKYLRRFNQERPFWTREKPHQALMAALVSVAAGRPRPVEETEMQLITRSTEPAENAAAMTQEITAPEDYEPVWFDWTILDNFDRTYTAVDTGCDTDEQGSDGNDGGDGDGGGENSGDYGDFGGGGD